MLWRQKSTALRACIAIALLVVALHLVITFPIWEWLPGMQYLLYPYRFGLLLSVFVPFGLVWSVGTSVYP